ncbi:hypothetical protein BDI4_40074 [Burkholderia diffusa]|uniref:hypothetical protein n=1 Tax=Burkholderia diffusa TaxID=488732 RepID=UPI001CAE58C0|nr:hypothetical protein [Burkholderia diffusa]CAG9253998.1 hypothetical protein BDI4_40074 [Burkholderia diffusa]
MPIVNRDQSSTASTFRSGPAPLRWPSIGTSVSQAQPVYYGLKAAMPSGGGSAGVAASSNAGYGSTLAAADVDAASAGDGFDWLGIAETVAGADDEGGDTSTPLGDAQPFDHTPDALGDNVDKLAGTVIADWAISTGVTRHGHAAGLYFISRKEDGGNERYR